MIPCVYVVKTSDGGSGLTLDGRRLTVCLAVSRDAAQHITSENRTKRTSAASSAHGNRNLHLVRESCALLSANCTNLHAHGSWCWVVTK